MIEVMDGKYKGLKGVVKSDVIDSSKNVVMYCDKTPGKNDRKMEMFPFL